MNSIKRILVAVKDPAVRRSPAIDKAAQLAVALGAQLELFHCPDVSVFAEDELEARRLHGAALREAHATCLKQLETLAARPRAKKIRTTVSAGWDYPAYEAVIRRALRSRADLIVAHCHEGRRIAPALLHLADWELVRHSPIPVLLIKNDRPYRRPTILAAVDPAQSFSKPRGLDEEILDQANLLRRASRGALHVIHDHVPVEIPLVSPGLLAPPLVLESSREAEAEARSRLVKLLRGMKIKTSHLHLTYQSPQNAIPAVARKARAAIVVMGSIARSGWKHAFIGNTAERVINELSCDVLVVKPRGFRTKVPRRSRGLRVVPPMPF